MVQCPICARPVKSTNINQHIDSQCQEFIESHSLDPVQEQSVAPVSSFFQRPVANRAVANVSPKRDAPLSVDTPRSASKKPVDERGMRNKRHMDFTTPSHISDDSPEDNVGEGLALKRQKIGNAFQNELPLAARIRPKTLDEVCGQDLVGPKGVLRELIMQDRIPSMVLWGGPGTGKTTIGRVIASMTKSRFIEMNSTHFGVGECKKVFSEVYFDILLVLQIFYRHPLTVLQARSEQKLTGRKTIIFCDEIHRFSKSQQEIFCKNLLAYSPLIYFPTRLIFYSCSGTC